MVQDGDMNGYSVKYKKIFKASNVIIYKAHFLFYPEDIFISIMFSLTQLKQVWK